MGVRNHPTSSSLTNSPPPSDMYYLMKFPSLWGKAKEEESAPQPISRKVFIAFFCFPFFIFVLEPLVLRVFFLYASINFMTTYFMFSHLMKSNRFHYSFPLIISLITFEFLLFLFSFQLPKKEEARSIFTYSPPSNSKILLSLFGSFVIELIKKRKSLHKLIYPHNENREELEDTLL